MSDFKIGSVDKVVAPTKTAQDLLDAMKFFCGQNMRKDFGFTRKELRAFFRTDDHRSTRLLQAGLAAGYFREVSRRVYPEPKFFSASFLEVMGPAILEIVPIRDRSRIDCSWCGFSTTTWPTPVGAQDRLVRTNFHEQRQSHSLNKSATNHG